MRRFLMMVDEYIVSRNAAGTRYLYGLFFKQWMEFVTQKKIDPRKPSLSQVSSFRDYLVKDQKLSSGTMRHTIVGLRAIYGHLLATGSKAPVQWNPFKIVPIPPVERIGKTQIISEEDAAAIIAAAGNASTRDVLVLKLLHETGMRRASIATLEKANIFRRDQDVVLRITLKGGSHGEVTIRKDTAAALIKYSSDVPGRWIFAGDDSGHLHPSAINKILIKYVKGAGIQKRVHPHQFRAAFITAALDAGVSLTDVQRAAHHATPDTTLRYDRGQRGRDVAQKVAEFRKAKAR